MCNNAKAIQSVAETMSRTERAESEIRAFPVKVACNLFFCRPREMWVRMLKTAGTIYVSCSGCEHWCTGPECSVCVNYITSLFQNDPHRDPSGIFHIPPSQENP